MALRISAFVLVAAGIAGFFVGLYGVVPNASLLIAATGMALLVAGLIALLFSLRRVRPRIPHASLFVVVAMAIVLHMWEMGTGPAGNLQIGFLLWLLLPYALCLIVAMFSTRSFPALVGAVVVLLVDLSTHEQVFVHPSSSTASIGLLFVPLWNTLIFAPVAMLAAGLLLRLPLAARMKPF